MKQGITSTLVFELETNISDITSVIFTFKEKVDSEVFELQKSYPKDATYEDGKFKLPLTQEDTEKLTTTFFVEAQVNLSNKSVIKSDICKKIMPPTLWTTIIEDNESDGNEEIISLTFTDYVQGGGSSTTDYNELLNIPTYNNTVWKGNMTDESLNIATKTELSGKADKSSTYTKSEIDISLSDKADKSNTYTTSEVYSKVEVDNIELLNGRTLDVSINSSTFVCTFTLKNGNGETLSSGSIDLPLESVVVSGEYNAQTKKVVLTLQNGSTIEFSIADLVDGLVSTTDLQTILADYQPLLTVTGHGTLNNGTLNIDASKTYFGTDSGNRINATGQYADIQEGDLYILTVNYQSIVKVVDSVYHGTGTPYFTVKPIDNTIVSSSARPNSMADYNYTMIDIGCVWVDTTNNRVSVLKAHSGEAPNTIFNWIDLPNASDLNGKQDTIDSTHKLSADNVDDSSTTNKFVTASDKTAWNGKQDEIDSSHKLSSDLVDDTNNTNLFVTSSEKSTWNAKADTTDITTDTTSTTVSLTLADNHEYRYTQDLSALTLTMPNGDFIASVVFVSGTTPTSATYDSSIKWSGDDVTSNAFVPVASKTYNIVFWYDGININAVVRGVA